MRSTAEKDRKRRHLSSISSPTAATPKKHHFTPLSEHKKYQNQKLVQKLEAQKVERAALEKKFCEMEDKQKSYDETLSLVKTSWEKLVDELESRCVSMNHGLNAKLQSGIEDRTQSPANDALNQLLAEDATESSSANNFANQNRKDSEMAIRDSNGVLCNVVTAIDNLPHLKDRLHSEVMQAFPEDGSCRQTVSNDLWTEVERI